MGDGHSDGRFPGRRYAHPRAAGPGGRADDTVTGKHTTGVSEGVDAELELMLAAALRENALGDEGERRAVAAFRAARELGAHQARTRRRDDWRPRAERWPARRRIRTTVTMLLASLTVGGVAVAGIGSVGSSPDRGDDDRGRAYPSTASGRPGASDPSASQSTSDGPASPGRPTTAKDTLAHCRAYESVAGNGNAMDSTAWQRLVEAAGGEQRVGAYCARELAEAARTATPRATKTPEGKPDHPGATNPADPANPANPVTPSSGVNGTQRDGKPTPAERAPER
ncbi:hypothetical protein [Streptomyces cavernae]|uniref:hypothetical protein n=1 Tax=Streptomyces cavernae TaxID=2259034 RepID=UPI001EE3F2F0|nr:hypothetical protein [Streptomyces cavernae]